MPPSMLQVKYAWSNRAVTYVSVVEQKNNSQLEKFSMPCIELDLFGRTQIVAAGVNIFYISVNLVGFRGNKLSGLGLQENFRSGTLAEVLKIHVFI